MRGYTLHAQLVADTLPLINLQLCEVRLMNNRLFPWLVLIPMRQNMREVTDLSAAERTVLMQETCSMSEVLQAITQAEKMNMAALGNMVPQLHVHVIARYAHDAAWPNPVWGRGSEPYAPGEAERLVSSFREALAG